MALGCVVLCGGGLQGVVVPDQLLQQSVGLSPLGGKVFFLSGELRLGFLQRDLLLRQILTGAFDLLRGLLHLFEHPVIGQGDLVDRVHAVEHIRKAAGFEQDRPVGDLAVFRHGADAGLITLVERVALGQSGVKLVLLFCDQKIVFLNLLVLVGNGILGQLDLLVDLALLPDKIEHIRLVFLDLRGQRVLLRGNGALALLEIVDFFLDVRRGLAEGREDDAEQQNCRQQDRNHAHDHTSILVHSSLLYTSRNLRMDITLPKMPTNRPAAPKVTTIGISRVVKGTISNICSASTRWISLAIRS